MLLRYDPFRELDRFTDGFFNGPDRRTWMPMDAVRKDDLVEIHFDLPGVRPDSIDLTVERNVLTVKAERDWIPAEGAEILARERTHGSWTRQVLLGETLDADRLEASYDHGVLSVRVPVAEQAKPRKVEVQSDKQAIDVAANA